MSDLKVDGQQTILSLSVDFPSNGYWTHYKGGIYQLITLGVKEDTGEVLVVYKSLKHLTVWIRTLSNFTENVVLPTGTVPRFKRGVP